MGWKEMMDVKKERFFNVKRSLKEDRMWMWSMKNVSDWYFSRYLVMEVVKKGNRNGKEVINCEDHMQEKKKKKS